MESILTLGEPQRGSGWRPERLGYHIAISGDLQLGPALANSQKFEPHRRCHYILILKDDLEEAYALQSARSICVGGLLDPVKRIYYN